MESGGLWLGLVGSPVTSPPHPLLFIVPYEPRVAQKQPGHGRDHLVEETVVEAGERVRVVCLGKMAGRGGHGPVVNPMANACLIGGGLCAPPGLHFPTRVLADPPRDRRSSLRTDRFALGQHERSIRRGYFAPPPMEFGSMDGIR